MRRLDKNPIDTSFEDLRIQTSSTQRGCWLEGYIGTPHGYVKAVSRGLDYNGVIPSQVLPDTIQITTLEMIVGGMRYFDSKTEAYLARKLVTVATEFAGRVAKEKGEPCRTPQKAMPI